MHNPGLKSLDICHTTSKWKGFKAGLPELRDFLLLFCQGKSEVQVDHIPGAVCHPNQGGVLTLHSLAGWGALRHWNSSSKGDSTICRQGLKAQVAEMDCEWEANIPSMSSVMEPWEKMNLQPWQTWVQHDETVPRHLSRRRVCQLCFLTTEGSDGMNVSQSSVQPHLVKWEHGLCVLYRATLMVNEMMIHFQEHWLKAYYVPSFLLSPHICVSWKIFLKCIILGILNSCSSHISFPPYWVN